MVDRKSELRLRIWDLLEVTEHPDTGKVKWDWVHVFLFVLILASVVVVILETVQSIYAPNEALFRAFDVFTVGVFTVEYVARLWACTADPKYAHPVTGRLRYAFSFYGVVDVLAVAPFYVDLLLPVALLDMRFLRVLRLMRFARVLKIGRYSEALDRLKDVFRAKKADLGVAFMGVAVVLVLASSLMYHVENAAQPEQFSSIPAAMWWGISALTTVGYGDIQPITPLGKVLGGSIQLLGIALFALPAGILAAGYEEEARRRRAGKNVCSTCGRALDDHNPG
jgi:voltage-gated potassium channel